jgi:hypothetical protein
LTKFLQVKAEMFEAPGEERAPKRIVAESSNPLHDRGILQSVLEYVGSGHYLFMGKVSKQFRACYLTVPVLEDVYSCEHGDDIEIKFEPYTTACTAIFESLSCLRLAVQLGFTVDAKSCSCQMNAGSAADIETLVELHEQHHMQYTADVSRGAAQSGSVSKLQWLLDEQDCPQSDDLDLYAVLAPTLDVLKWLRQRGCEFTANTCAEAAMATNAASILQYLHSEGAPFGASTMVQAITNQDSSELPLLQWLYERGCPLSEAAMKAAVALEDPSILHWLHSIDCPCDYDHLCYTATSDGNIGLLQWIKDKHNGAPDWSSEALSVSLNIAGVEGHLDVAKVRDHNTANAAAGGTAGAAGGSAGAASASATATSAAISVVSSTTAQHNTTTTTTTAPALHRKVASASANGDALMSTQVCCSSRS